MLTNPQGFVNFTQGLLGGPGASSTPSGIVGGIINVIIKSLIP